jgi:hypothetical protein
MVKATLSEKHIQQLQKALQSRAHNHRETVEDTAALGLARELFESILPKIHDDDTDGPFIIWETTWAETDADRWSKQRVGRMLKLLIDSSRLATAGIEHQYNPDGLKVILTPNL